MKRRRRTSSFAKAVELSMVAPQVMALRAMRLHDRQELARMSSEKTQACLESMSAMAIQAWWTGWLAPWSPARYWSGIIDKGLAPVHRRVTGNRRRLSRRKKR